MASIAEVARAHADETEAGRRLAPAVVDAFRAEGIFHLLAPRSVGGREMDVPSTMSVTEGLSRADGSAGWCATIGATYGLLAAHLAPETAKSVFGGDSVMGGAFAPRGTASRVDGGFRVDGRWQFASGCQHCDWLVGGCLIEGEVPRMMIIPRSDVEIIDTWRVSGLRGTGSHDIAVTDLFVEESHSVPLVAGPPRESGTLYRFPFFGVLAVVGATVPIGIAQRAIDEFVALAEGKTPTGARKALAERQAVQAQVAQAEAAVRSARAFLYDTASDAWARAQEGNEIGVDLRALLRLAATDATSRSAQAVDLMYTAAGGTAIYESSPLQRCFRDVHAITQHIMVAPPTYELVGRILLGLETETSML